MDLLSFGNYVISGLTGAAAALSVAGFFAARWIRRSDERDARNEAQRDQKIEALASHEHPLLEHRLTKAEQALSAVNVPLLNQQIGTLVDLANRTAGEVSSVRERQGEIASDVKNTRDHIAGVSKKAGVIAERLDSHLEDHARGKK